MKELPFCISKHLSLILLMFNCSNHGKASTVVSGMESNAIHTHTMLFASISAVSGMDDMGMPLFNLTGDILSPLFNLELLEHLDLSENSFNGVPITLGLARLKSLCHLDLSAAGFSGDIPREVGSMSTLHYINLSRNSLLRLVDMQSWRANMRDLHELILDYVNISRVVSKDKLDNVLSTMYSLTRLQMSGCFLSEEIPPSLANLTSLTHLQLHDNKFNGSIPSALLGLPRLQLLELSWNYDLGGNLSRIPDSVVNIFFLTLLDLSECYVESIPITMTNLPVLQKLDHRYNMLRGHILPFGGTSSPLGRPFSLTYIDLSGNRFGGPIPPILLAATLNLQHVDLSYSQLTGEIPSSIAESLATLDLSSNKLEGAIPLNISNSLN